MAKNLLKDFIEAGCLLKLHVLSNYSSSSRTMNKFNSLRKCVYVFIFIKIKKKKTFRQIFDHAIFVVWLFVANCMHLLRVCTH